MDYSRTPTETLLYYRRLLRAWGDPRFYCVSTDIGRELRRRAGP
jgi:hypothetical protein